jgi:Beta-propeller repeat
MTWNQLVRTLAPGAYTAILRGSRKCERRREFFFRNWSILDCASARTSRILRAQRTRIMQKKSHSSLVLAAGIAISPALVCMFSWMSPADVANSKMSALPLKTEVSSGQWRADYAQLPLSFEANRGQAGDSAGYLARGSGYMLRLEATTASFQLRTRTDSAELRMRVLGGDPCAQAEELNELEGKVNYFIGSDPAQWRQNIPTYGRVRYRDVYPGIDLVYYGNQRQLEYDFNVAPGEDAGAIQLRFEGADKVTVDPNGDLLVAFGETILRQPKPIVYQEVDGKRRLVDGGYRVSANSEVGFAIGRYDTARSLVIDPTIVYSTYLGSSTGTVAIALDSAGNVYVAGSRNTAGSGGLDGFVSKINAAGTAVVYSTVFGGTGAESLAAIAVDSAGNAYVTGFTQSTNFPTANAIQAIYGGSQDAFVTKINAAGSALVYSTYLGGSNSEVGAGIDVDGAGNAYTTGNTQSTNFPTANALQATSTGGDAYVTKINAAGSAFVYSTYLGGSNGDSGSSLKVDGAGNVYLTGTTGSTDFPAVNPIQGTNAGPTSFPQDAFVTKINAAGTALVYSTYLGGIGFDNGLSIAIDPVGNAYVTGTTHSNNFPVANAIQPAKASTGNNRDAFVTKINAAGSAFVYSTYLGGATDQIGYAIAADASGNAYVTGETSSASGFPLVNAIQCTRKGPQDAFITKLDPAGSTFLYSTYLGGSDYDAATAVALDASHNAYIAGATYSNDFPTVNPIQSASGQTFVTKLNDAVSPNSCVPTPTPTPEAQLLNLSIRSRVLTGDKVQIAGIIVSGNVPKRVIFRVIGNSMKVGGNPVPGRLANPTLALYDSSGTQIASNDDWGMAPEPERTQIETGGLKPDDPQEPAILRTLAVGQYTVVVRGKDDTTGLAVVETYDLDQSAPSRLANVSGRSFVGINDDVIIGGAIVKAPGAEVVVRGIGPSLKGVPLEERLADPTLQVVDSNGVTIAQNDDWQTNQANEIAATGLQPESPKEAAIRLVLPAGGNTIVLRGKNNTTGVSLVEVYNVP